MFKHRARIWTIILLVALVLQAVPLLVPVVQEQWPKIEHNVDQWVEKMGQQDTSGSQQKDEYDVILEDLKSRISVVRSAMLYIGSFLLMYGTIQLTRAYTNDDDVAQSHTGLPTILSGGVLMGLSLLTRLLV